MVINVQDRFSALGLVFIYCVDRPCARHDSHAAQGGPKIPFNRLRVYAPSTTLSIIYIVPHNNIPCIIYAQCVLNCSTNLYMHNT